MSKKITILLMVCLLLSGGFFTTGCDDSDGSGGDTDTDTDTDVDGGPDGG